MAPPTRRRDTPPRWRPRTSARSHPVRHELAAPRDEHGTPARDAWRFAPTGRGPGQPAAFAARHAGLVRSGQRDARAARAQRTQRRRQRLAARTGRR